MNYIYHPWIELESIARKRITQVYSSLMASKVIQYPYRILSLLSLLLILEMVVVAGISSVPAEYEYEWVFGWLLLITMLAWAGIAGVVSICAPIGGEMLKRRGRIILVLSSALFATSIFSPILGATLFQSAFLADLFWQSHLLLFLIVWIGIVVVIGATSDAATGRKIYLRIGVFHPAPEAGFTLYSTKTYLLIGVFPLLVVAYSEMLWTAFVSMGLVLDLLEPLDLYTDLLINLLYFLGVLFIILSTTLVIGAVVLRSTLDVPRVVVAIVALGISIVVFGSAIGVGYLLFFFPYSGSVDPPPASAVSFIISVPVLWSLTISVFGAMLVGTMRRPIRNITVTGVGIVAMTLALALYLHLTDIWEIFR